DAVLLTGEGEGKILALPEFNVDALLFHDLSTSLYLRSVRRSVTVHATAVLSFSFASSALPVG
ncbi:MAG: hypothetical protein N2Z74_07595, partial [Syntrophales bacterium]|nr:hypothetical protein [Syntrophales bacterium]